MDQEVNQWAPLFERANQLFRCLPSPAPPGG
jgi:hypothetical protein